MTLEAINTDSRVVVTGPAEVFRVIDRHGFCIRAYDRVAADTVFQAERFVTQALNNGLVTLVVKKVHVVSSHKIGVGDTLLTLALRDIGHGNTTGLSRFARCL